MKKIVRNFAAALSALTVFAYGTVFADAKPVMELSFDGKNYQAGEIATAEIIVYNASYNVLGFALEYGDNVIVVDENGDAPTSGDVAVRLEDVMYRGKGIYSVLDCEVTAENIKTSVYVNPGSSDEDVKDNSVTVGNGGRKVATIAFKMTEDGIPDVDFSVISGDVDFGTVPFFMMNNGTQPAGSISQIKYTEDNPKPDSQNQENEKPADKKPADKENDEKNKNDKAPDSDVGKNDENVIISTVVPDDDPTVTGGNGIDISDIVQEPSFDTENNGEDASVDEENDISPFERAVGIGILGIAFGIVCGVVMNQLIKGHKKDMDHIRDNLNE